MTTLKYRDLGIIDNAFDMHSGYVLDFSDRTFAAFFDEEFNVDIGDERYYKDGTSKAKRLRCFLKIENANIVARVLRELWKCKKSSSSNSFSFQELEKPPKDVETPLFELIARIEGDDSIPRTDALARFSEDKTLGELIRAIERDIAANKPAPALDRLHTYCMKKMSHLIITHGGSCNRTDRLHSKMGKYIKLLKQNHALNVLGRLHLCTTPIW